MITTLIMVLLLSIGMNIPYFIQVFKGEDGGAQSSGVHIAVIAENGSPAAQLLQAYTKQPGLDATVTRIPQPMPPA